MKHFLWGVFAIVIFAIVFIINGQKIGPAEIGPAGRDDGFAIPNRARERENAKKETYVIPEEGGDNLNIVWSGGEGEGRGLVGFGTVPMKAEEFFLSLPVREFGE